MGVDSQKRLLRQINGIAAAALTPYVDDNAYLNRLLREICDIAYKGIHYVDRIKREGIKFMLPVTICLDGHLPIRIKSYMDSGVEQFDYVYGEDFGVVNVLKMRNGKIEKYDKTEFCKQIDAAINWMPWSPVVVEHNVEKEGNKLSGGVAER